jgi:enolase
LLKINQVGTVSKLMKTAAMAKRFAYTPIYSTRSSETNDPSQVDLALAMDVRFMKVGAPIRGEMIAKYNRLLKIESELGENSSFRGEEFRFDKGPC